MARLTANGITLAYDDRGAGKPAMLLIHGWTCDRSFFAPQADYFAGRHRVVSVDLRGHGETEKPEGGYSIEVFAEDLAHLIEHLGLGKVVAVGHSLGALVALQLAAAYPDRVAAIVMVDAAPMVPTPEFRARLQEMVAAIEAGDQNPRRQFIVNRLFLPTSSPELVERVLKVMLAAPNSVAAGAMRAVLDFDGRAAAARCTVPALHIAAARPPNPPQLLAELLPGLIQGQTVGAGHFNQLEAPDQVNAMIEAFLRHCAGRSESAAGERV